MSDFYGQWLVVVNPNAGNRKCGKDWPEISRILESQNIPFHAVMTQHRSHAVHLTEEYVGKGFQKILVVGGDGTLNEVVNGIFRQQRFAVSELLLGMIMVGTGNDWGRMYRIPSSYEKAVKAIRKERRFIQDAGMVSYTAENGEPVTRYFLNMAGLGFDALVALKTNMMKDKGRGGTLAYLYNLVMGLFRYHHVPVKISIDGENVYDDRMFSMNIGICRYNGGGMKQAPMAIPDDGIFDVTVFRAISKLRVLTNVYRLYSGNFAHLSLARIFRGKEIEVRAMGKRKLLLEADGESLGSGPFTFNILPRSVAVIVGKKFLDE